MFYFLKRALEDNGEPSSMRLIVFETVNVAFVLALVEVIRGTLSVDSIGLILGLLSIAYTGKVIQKGKEGGS